MQFDPYERGALAQALRDGAYTERVGYLTDKCVLAMVKAVEGWLVELPAERLDALVAAAAARRRARGEVAPE